MAPCQWGYNVTGRVNIQIWTECKKSFPTYPASSLSVAENTNICFIILESKWMFTITFKFFRGSHAAKLDRME